MESDIAISDPIDFSLEAVEYSKEFPSVNFRCIAKIQPTSQSCSITYEHFLWVQSDVFDRFVDALRKKEAVALFENMDGDFLLRIIRADGKIRFGLEVKTRSVYVNVLALQYEIDISEDAALILKERFEAFPKWW